MHKPLFSICLVAALASACATKSSGSASAPQPAAPGAFEPAAPDAPANVAGVVDVAGPWHGSIDAGPLAIAIDVALQRSPEGWSGTLDVPEQDLQGLSLSNIVLDASRIAFEATLPNGLVVYFDGEQEGDTIKGSYRQGLGTTTFALDRGPRPASEYLTLEKALDPRIVPIITEWVETVPQRASGAKAP